MCENMMELQATLCNLQLTALVRRYPNDKVLQKNKIIYSQSWGFNCSRALHFKEKMEQGKVRPVNSNPVISQGDEIHYSTVHDTISLVCTAVASYPLNALFLSVSFSSPFSEILKFLPFASNLHFQTLFSAFIPKNLYLNSLSQHIQSKITFTSEPNLA